MFVYRGEIVVQVSGGFNSGYLNFLRGLNYHTSASESHTLPQHSANIAVNLNSRQNN